MALTLLGTSTFTDIGNPAPSKNEWGVDRLVRRVKGPSSGLAAYVATLAQGQIYNSSGYYLQSWEPEDRPPYAIVTLVYKGLFAGIPTPVADNEIVQLTGGASADFSSLNSGKGYQYGVDSTGAQLYAVGATREFAYYAPRTLWRYIRNGKPNGPFYSHIDFISSPSIIKSRIVTSDGAVFGGNAPAGLVSALALSAGIIVDGFRSLPIVGTPYYECEDSVTYGYPGA